MSPHPLPQTSLSSALLSAAPQCLQDEVLGASWLGFLLVHPVPPAATRGTSQSSGARPASASGSHPHASSPASFLLWPLSVDAASFRGLSWVGSRYPSAAVPGVLVPRQSRRLGLGASLRDVGVEGSAEALRPGASLLGGFLAGSGGRRSQGLCSSILDRAPPTAEAAAPSAVHLCRRWRRMHPHRLSVSAWSGWGVVEFGAGVPVSTRSRGETGPHWVSGQCLRPGAAPAPVGARAGRRPKFGPNAEVGLRGSSPAGGGCMLSAYGPPGPPQGLRAGGWAGVCSLQLGSSVRPGPVAWSQRGPPPCTWGKGGTRCRHSDLAFCVLSPAPPAGS